MSNWFTKLIGSTSGNVAEINAVGELLVALPVEPLGAGYAKLATAGGDEVAFTEHGQLSVAQESLVLYEQVDGTAIDIRKWLASVTTMTITQAAGFQVLNGSAITTANGVAQLTTVKHFPLFGEFRFTFDVGAKVTVGPQANATMELGIGLASGTSAPTDGAFFRWASDATFRAVISFGGVEIISGPLTAPVLNQVLDFDIEIDNDEVRFYIADVEVAELVVPTSQPYPTSSARLPGFGRVMNGASAPAAAPVMQIGRWTMTQNIAGVNRAWAETQVGMGASSVQSPVTTFGQSANHANSTSPSSAALSNTAAGYSTLGGRFQFAAPAGAATDFALFGFQVPVGYQLFITALRISTVNTGAAVATTATVMDWSIGVNSSAVSLATADGAGTWAPRRLPLGLQAFPVGSAIGAVAGEIWMVFDTPLVCEGGRFVHIILQVPVGTATASQVIRGDVMVNGYFE